jgi:SAM-dependent methyltransferase
MISKDFNPSYKHQFYIIRSGLYKKITEHQHLLTGKMMDFGCGSKPYQSVFSNITEYVGVDYMSEGHSHQNENIDVYYNGKTLPFPDQSFNSIFSSEVFEHIFNLDEILPELYRVLAPGGKILITCPFVWNEHEVPVDFARYTQFALKHLFEKAGFTIIKIDKAGDFLSVIHQLRIMYFRDVYLLKAKIPIFMKSPLRRLGIPWMNLKFILKRKIFPTNDTLYFNNIVIAERKA